MSEEDLKHYRKILQKEYIDRDSGNETSLTYISVGALIFFLAINNEFFKLVMAEYKFLLVISLFFLFFAFIMILIRKSKTVKYEFDMITFVDKMEADSESAVQDLMAMWDKTHMNLTLLQTLISLGLALGIGLQVLFMILNFS